MFKQILHSLIKTILNILDAVARGDDDGILVDIYDNVQDELRAMKRRYEAEKKKVNATKRFTFYLRLFFVIILNVHSC